LIISLVDHQIEITRITLSRRKNCSHEKESTEYFSLFFCLEAVEKSKRRRRRRNLPITKKRKTNKNSL